VQEIKSGDNILARLIHASDSKDGLSFFSREEDSIQIGTWKYENGVELKRHIHNEVPRSINRTQEVLVVLSGSIEATIYDLEQREVAKLEAGEGDILVLLDSGHGYRVLSDGTKVVEIKNGPYLGAEIDRRRF